MHEIIAINCRSLALAPQFPGNPASLSVPVVYCLVRSPWELRASGSLILPHISCCAVLTSAMCAARTCALQLVLDIRRLTRALQEDAADSTVDVVEMASRLSTMGYRVTVCCSRWSCYVCLWWCAHYWILFVIAPAGNTMRRAGHCRASKPIGICCWAVVRVA